MLTAYVTERPVGLRGVERPWFAHCPGFGARRFATLSAAVSTLGRWQAERQRRFPGAWLKLEVRPCTGSGSAQWRVIRERVESAPSWRLG